MTEKGLSKYVEFGLGTCSFIFGCRSRLPFMMVWDKREHRRDIFRGHSIQACLHHDTRMILMDPFRERKPAELFVKISSCNISRAARFWSFTSLFWLSAAVLPHITQQKSNIGRTYALYYCLSESWLTYFDRRFVCCSQVNVWWLLPIKCPFTETEISSSVDVVYREPSSIAKVFK